MLVSSLSPGGGPVARDQPRHPPNWGAILGLGLRWSNQGLRNVPLGG